jgi:hypothetical protein
MGSARKTTFQLEKTMHSNFPHNAGRADFAAPGWERQQEAGASGLQFRRDSHNQLASFNQFNTAGARDVSVNFPDQLRGVHLPEIGLFAETSPISPGGV